jgi:hypothetical protein
MHTLLLVDDLFYWKALAEDPPEAANLPASGLDQTILNRLINFYV